MGVLFPPKAFHFPAARFPRAPAGLPFTIAGLGSEEWGGSPGDAAQASLSPPSPS